MNQEDHLHSGIHHPITCPAVDSFELVSARYPLIRTPTGCWEWQGARSGGYGMIKRDSRLQGAHRVLYEEFRGPIPPGMQLDHLCRNTLCCNPDHLEPVTQRENTLRGIGPTAANARKTHCLHGHPFDEANTLWRKGGGRRCRACQRELDHERFGRDRRPAGLLTDVLLTH